MADAILTNGTVHIVKNGLIRCTQVPPPAGVTELINHDGYWWIVNGRVKVRRTKPAERKFCQKCRDAAYTEHNPAYKAGDKIGAR